MAQLTMDSHRPAKFHQYPMKELVEDAVRTRIEGVLTPLPSFKSTAWLKNFKNTIIRSKLSCQVSEKSVVRLPFFKKSGICVTSQLPPSLG